MTRTVASPMDPGLVFLNNPQRSEVKFKKSMSEGSEADLKAIPSITRFKLFNHVRGKRSDDDDSSAHYYDSTLL